MGFAAPCERLRRERVFTFARKLPREEFADIMRTSGFRCECRELRLSALPTEEWRMLDEIKGFKGFLLSVYDGGLLLSSIFMQTTSQSGRPYGWLESHPVKNLLKSPNVANTYVYSIIML